MFLKIFFPLFCVSRLHMEMTPLVVCAVAAALKQNTTLKCLNLCGNPIGAQGAMALASALKVNATLVALDFHWSDILDDGGVALGELIKTSRIWTKMELNGLNITSGMAIHIAEALQENTLLKTLDLMDAYNRKNPIGAVGARAFIEALKVNTTLTQLKLPWSNIIDDDGGFVLVEMIEMNEIRVDMRLNHSNITSTVAVRIAEALKVNTVLKTLDLRSNPIGFEGAMALAEALRVNTILERLDVIWSEINDNENRVALLELFKTGKVCNLTNANITAPIAMKIAEVLKESTLPKTLDLRNNPIGAAGALAFVEVLWVNKALEELELPWSNIVDDGGVVLAELIKCSRIWTTLDFSWSRISAGVLSHICEALKGNSVLKYLYFRGCEIGNNVARLIAEMLKSNKSLEKLNLDQNPFDIHGALIVVQGIAENNALKVIQFPKYKDVTMLLPWLTGNDVLLRCGVFHDNILPRERVDLWKGISRDCVQYCQLFEEQIPDGGSEIWRFTRALFRARKD